MPSTASLLTNLETCTRKGWFSTSWSSQRLKSSAMTLQAIRTALRAETGDFGEIAGSEVMQLAQDRGLDTDSHKIYDSVVHHACVADLIVTAVRKPSDTPWLTCPKLDNWESECFISPDGLWLRRILLVSNWSNSRHASEIRSWRTYGEIAHYNLPMQMIVCIIGQERDGLRSSPWSIGFLHPANHGLRFRKKQRTTSEVFNDKWERIHREDHAEISRETWLNAMLKDDVLNEVLFREDIPIPDHLHLLRIRGMAERKLDRLREMKQKPEGNLSSCDWPVPCEFRKCCHIIPEQEPSEKNGFVYLNSAS